MKIGIIGAGAMGTGIAQVAATSKETVIIFDTQAAALDKSSLHLKSTFEKLVEKGKWTAEQAAEVRARISIAQELTALADCDLIIEAVVEKMEIKKSIFKSLDEMCKPTAILASNTSSLSITAIASACSKPERVMGIHFFNPAPLMPLVEIIPALQSDEALIQHAYHLIKSWGKVPVIAKDTPGFIVNRVARPFYGEALRIFEEGIADMATIDQAMREGGFKMGPFELMDLIGNDVNYAVTESVFEAFYYDPRFKPSLTQKKNVEAGWLGRKTGRGYYSYKEGAVMPSPSDDAELKQNVFQRILVMLINEAYDALYLKVATAEDLDLAMTKGVNYPKGLIQWSEEIGTEHCRALLDSLYEYYHEDRYRCSPALRNEG
ncbi:MAG: 3-hydroxyacyl-CoA dehydrogenase NAD-binding domain-containing protein [Flavobacteriales bacterium]|jgi:3-hydroxybutyryl-CoA dehydrogenase